MNQWRVSPYDGSRKQSQRFAHSDNSHAGFIEMFHSWSTGAPEEVIEKFRLALQSVQGVQRVEYHPSGSKEQQKNVGNHYQGYNFVVLKKQ